MGIEPTTDRLPGPPADLKSVESTMDPAIPANLLYYNILSYDCKAISYDFKAILDIFYRHHDRLNPHHQNIPAKAVHTSCYYQSYL